MARDMYRGLNPSGANQREISEVTNGILNGKTNNTGEVIDRNEFVADIYIKPARSINFIYLNFVAVRTSVSFDEIGA